MLTSQWLEALIATFKLTGGQRGGREGEERESGSVCCRCAPLGTGGGAHSMGARRASWALQCERMSFAEKCVARRADLKILSENKQANNKIPKHFKYKCGGVKDWIFFIQLQKNFKPLCPFSLSRAMIMKLFLFLSLSSSTAQNIPAGWTRSRFLLHRTWWRRGWSAEGLPGTCLALLCAGSRALAPVDTGGGVAAFALFLLCYKLCGLLQQSLRDVFDKLLCCFCRQ